MFVVIISCLGLLGQAALAVARRTKEIGIRKLRSRGLQRQRVEVQICCKILNRMALFGMPDSYKVT